jgi:hypothetical protein
MSITTRGLRRDAGERDETHDDGDAHVEAQEVYQPKPAREREGHRQHDDERLGEPPKVQVEQDEDEEEVTGTTVCSRALARSRYSNWPIHSIW